MATYSVLHTEVIHLRFVISVKIHLSYSPVPHPRSFNATKTSDYHTVVKILTMQCSPLQSSIQLFLLAEHAGATFQNISKVIIIRDIKASWLYRKWHNAFFMQAAVKRVAWEVPSSNISPKTGVVWTFKVFLSSSTQTWSHYLKLSQAHVFLHRFQFIIH
jgi:hypothetical protein